MKYKRSYLKLKKDANRRLNRWKRNKKRAKTFGNRFSFLERVADRYIERANEDIDRIKFMYVYEKYKVRKGEVGIGKGVGE